MAVTIWSVDMDPQSDFEPADHNLPTDLIVQIRRQGSAPTHHSLRNNEPSTVRRPEHPSRRLRVRRIGA